MNKKPRKNTEGKQQNKSIKITSISDIVFDRSDFSPSGLAKIASVDGLAVVGKLGTAEAKCEYGVAIAGKEGNAHGGEWGFALAGDEGKAIVGHNAIAYAGRGGTACGSDGAIAIVFKDKDKKAKAKVKASGTMRAGDG